MTDLLTVWDAARWSNVLTKWTDAQQWMAVTSEAVNFNLVDFYPFLRRPYDIIPHWLLPGKRKLYELQKLEDRVFFDLLYRTKAKLAAGNAYPSQFFSRSVAFTFTSNALVYYTQLTFGPTCTGIIRDMLEDKDDDRLDDRQVANNAAHGFGAAM